jgi:hypothetical protein
MNLVLTSTWGVSSPLSHSASPANQNSDIFLSKELSSQIDLDTSALVDNLVHGSGGDDTDSSPSFKNRSKGTHGASPHGQGRFAKGQYGMGRRHDGQQQRRVPMDHRMMGNSSFPIMMYPMAISSPAAGMHNNAVYVTSEQTGKGFAFLVCIDITSIYANYHFLKHISLVHLAKHKLLSNNHFT